MPLSLLGIITIALLASANVNAGQSENACPNGKKFEPSIHHASNFEREVSFAVIGRKLQNQSGPMRTPDIVSVNYTKGKERADPASFRIWRKCISLRLPVDRQIVGRTGKDEKARTVELIGEEGGTIYPVFQAFLN